MITDAILAVIFGVARAVVAIIPDWQPPDFVTQIGAKATEIGQMAAGFGEWVPWTLAGTVVGAVIATYLTMNGVRFTMWLWSKLPVVGK